MKNKNSLNRSRNKLAKLGLIRPIDLILYLPIRYENETKLTKISKLLPGYISQVEGIVIKSEIVYQPRRQLIIKLKGDDKAVLILRFLNFYSSQVKKMSIGQRLRVRGAVRNGFLGIEIVHPLVRVIDICTPLPKTLTPVYLSKSGISQSYLRKAIDSALDCTPLPELLPAEINNTYLKPLGLPTLADAIRTLHHPDIYSDETKLMDGTHPAWTRIKFDELLVQQLSLNLTHDKRRMLMSPEMPYCKAYSDSDSLTKRLFASLPFTLTNAQIRVIEEIGHDLTCSYPMQRLLHGDVGSGKTVVAALAATQAIDAGYQTAMMAPTEILVGQLVHKLRTWLEPLGISIVYLIGSMKIKEKRKAIEPIRLGTAQLVIGTHTLIQDTVNFARLGLVIIDEQHRFGVEQRLALRNKTAKAIRNITNCAPNVSTTDFIENTYLYPHQLMMSATPIPRTLAMTYYAGFDISTIDELPPNRVPILTKLVSDSRRHEVVARVRDAAITGKQVYWVCPLIDESDQLQLETAVETYKMLKISLPELKVGLLHGRLSSMEKTTVMDSFLNNDVQLLVSTTVIEVGIDVPNASLMVIEHAERFGLAQLHQLRGRIGRGTSSSVCILLYSRPLSIEARERLKTMRETNDGFEIAQRDLEIRGPGEFLGSRQSGSSMLRFANLNNDNWLIAPARDAASQLIAKYPDIAMKQLTRWFGDWEQYIKA
ncbi:MAG: ATP-dependent DNA helicase RecG [Burkholderia sp.]|nr:ATP-dependent DNA helicase RecG [Burkholderia sp.]